MPSLTSPIEGKGAGGEGAPRFSCGRSRRPAASCSARAAGCPASPQKGRSPAAAVRPLLPFVHDRSAPQSRRWRDHLDRHPHLRDEDRSTASPQKVRLVDPVSSLDYRRAYSQLV